ncbi:glycosyl transferase [Candidatus Roizmanbacteria bacterium RIFCSPHIGHO2_02_FULL_40_13b]|nr:MAG: glycosyl transferase [Candidatus Roizmanbacteria bacterium RIFCSPHIGHO2_02_FULL_40_13b]
MKKVSIVIPVYNEEAYIGKTLHEVVRADIGNFEREIVIIDDGSQDATAQKITSFIHKNKRQKITFLQNKINEGKGASLKKGLLKTLGEIVIVQDADLEYSPRDYPLLLEPFLQNNADVVYGSRFISNRPHRVVYFWHFVANTFLTFFSNMLTNLNFTDMETGYKVFKGDVIRKIAPKLKSKRFGFEPEITARISKEKALIVYEVGISYSGRTYEEGKKIGWIDGVYAVFQIIIFNLFG